MEAMQRALSRPSKLEVEEETPLRLNLQNQLDSTAVFNADATLAPASSNRGAVFLDAADSSPRVGFASARCAGGTLLVDEVVQRRYPLARINEGFAALERGENGRGVIVFD